MNVIPGVRPQHHTLFFFFFFFFFFFGGGGVLCSPGGAGNHFVAQAGIERLYLEVCASFSVCSVVHEQAQLDTVSSITLNCFLR